MRLQVHPHPGVNIQTLELRIAEIYGPEFPRWGDLQIEFNASVESFSASGHFWLAYDEFKDFAAALRALSASRSGNATIHSLSPEELTLSLAMSDSDETPDYVRVTFAFNKFRPYPPSPYECSISVAFEVELGFLAKLIAWAENPTVDTASSEASDAAPAGYSRGEGQKLFGATCRQIWSAILAKKKRKER